METTTETTLKEIDFTKQENTLVSEKTITKEPFLNRTRIEGNENRKKIIIREQTANTMDVDILDYGITEEDKESDGTPITAEIMQNFRDVIEQADTNSTRAYNISKTAYENSETAYTNSAHAVTTSEEAKGLAETSNTKANAAETTANTANAKSDSAVSTANSANTKSDNATTTANTALSNSSTALSKSNEAITTSSTALANSTNALTKATTALTNSEQAISDSTYAKNKADEVESKLADRGATIKIGTASVTEVTFTSDPQAQINAINNTNSNQATEITNIKNNTTIIANSSGGFSCGSGATNGSGLQFKGFTLCDASGKIPVARLVDAIYPVGSIYMSTGSTSPASLFGGTWEQLKDRFLLGGGGSYTLGGTGGEANHTLTTSEMPSHRHGLSSSNAGSWCDDYDWVKPLANNGGGGANKSGAIAEMSISTGMGQRYVESYDAAYSGHIMEAIGGDSAHNNMPPYLVVNMWKRVS